MILMRYRTNNGCRCECCRQEEYDAIWIPREKMIPFHEILELAYSKPTKEYIFIQYENNGEILYGFRAEFTKTKYESYIIIGGKEYCIIAEGSDKSCLTREEIEQVYWNHIEEFFNGLSLFL